MPAVEVDELVVHHGETVAVDRVSFVAEAGEVTALLGPNGAGKTSTVEALEGYRRPDSGTARVLGLDPARDRRRLVSRVGVMLQRGGVYPTLSARDAVRLFAAYYDRPLSPDALIERVGLADVAATPYRRLSGGEQQRLSLALAVVGRPEVAFLDEPSAGVDPRGRQVIRELVGGLRDDGVAVVLTTHDLDEADRLADHLVIVDRGRVVASGAPEELRRGGSQDQVRFTTSPGLDLAELGRVLGGAVGEVRAGHYVARVAPSPRTVATLTGWLADRDLPVGDVQASRQSLEDVFLRLTSENDDPGEDRRRGRRR